MIEEIRLAMQACAKDPAAGEGALRALMIRDRDRFVRASLPLVRGDREHPGHQYLVKLLARNDQLVNQLCDPDCFSREAAIELARQMARFEPQLDTKLSRFLPGRDATLSNPANYAAIERVLELLEVVSTSARIVPALTHLMTDPNPRLRAKAALLIGQRVGNSRLAESWLQQTDPRVRANAIESLWGGAASSSAGVLQLAAKDGNNRVVGNALVGLYRMQDPGAVAQILAMAADPRPLFRTSAAWTMGQTGDPRFLPALEKLARDLFASVRKNASNAMERIQSNTHTTARLQLRILHYRDGSGVRRSLAIQALSPEGDPVHGLLPAQFLLWEGPNLVMDYSVTEHVNTEGLGVGFALCSGDGIPAELLKSAEEAVLGCLKLKTPEHHWALAKFVSTPERQAATGSPALYLPNAGELRTSIAEPPVETHCASAILAALRSLLPGAFHVRGDRHVILLVASDLVPSADMEEQADRAVANKVAIHAVVADSPHPSLMSLCRRTGGIVMSAAGGQELASAFRNLYLALMRRYEIRFRAESRVKLEIYCEEGYGTCWIDPLAGDD